MYFKCFDNNRCVYKIIHYKSNSCFIQRAQKNILKFYSWIYFNIKIYYYSSSRKNLNIMYIICIFIHSIWMYSLTNIYILYFYIYIFYIHFYVSICCIHLIYFKFLYIHIYILYISLSCISCICRIPFWPIIDLTTFPINDWLILLICHTNKFSYVIYQVAI